MALDWEDLRQVVASLDVERRQLLGAIDARDVGEVVAFAARLESAAVTVYQFAQVLAVRERGR
ncbi:hypothetical protein GCM10022220_02790 [Actinocatenispora rupis]|uniref:hypothetical protein n=1 Tax=Actinocatenispora rupis TaxID=519421 RepID=UPI0031F1AC9E